MVRPSRRRPVVEKVVLRVQEMMRQDAYLRHSESANPRLRSAETFCSASRIYSSDLFLARRLLEVNASGLGATNPTGQDMVVLAEEVTEM